MKIDELAFFNQQLAVMLREGIPLEGAIRQLVAGMQSGPLKDELELLQTDLQKGVTLSDALARRRLPEFYSRMLIAGAAAQDLPGILTLLADYYHRSHATWMRLKGLMIYPIIVIIVALLMTASLGVFFSRLYEINSSGVFVPQHGKAFVVASLWLSPGILALALAVCLVAASVPSVRAWVRWRLPAFREASLAQLAASMTLMLRNGVPLPEALRLAENLEDQSPAAPALAAWRGQIQAGQGKPAEWQARGKILPPLFLWVVRSAGDNLAAGFQKAAELYSARATYRTELMLYGVLPVSVLLLGQMILWQAVSAMHYLVQILNMIGALE
jgi:type II secretory pathway component PulF